MGEAVMSEEPRQGKEVVTIWGSLQVKQLD